jgi:hypothetical protein
MVRRTLPRAPPHDSLSFTCGAARQSDVALLARSIRSRVPRTVPVRLLCVFLHSAFGTAWSCAWPCL